MEFKDYITPVNHKLLNINNINDKHILLNNICIYDPIKNQQLSDFDLAIIGVPEDRNSRHKGCSLAPDLIRNYLYQLYIPNNRLNIIDFGNIKTGSSVNDTYIALRDIIYEFLSTDVVVIIIGGSSDITYSNYLAYEKSGRTVNISSVDSRLNLKVEADSGEFSYLYNIIVHKNNQLFNFTNIGYQSYFVSQEEIELANNLFFDYYRLGIIQSDIRKVEPVLRDSDLVSFSMSGLKQSEAPGNYFSSPNGFYGEEACQIAKYSGISDKVTSFGLYDLYPEYDRQDQSTHLAAQIIWHFIDGFYQRKKDYPYRDLSNYQKFIVPLVSINHDLIFYKSDKTDRWWIEVPYIKSSTKRNIIISCSHEDYQLACNQEIPDRWWKIFQKIS